MMTNTNGKQAIAGRTAGRKTGTAGTRQGQEQGQRDGVDFGASGAVCDRVVGGAVKGLSTSQHRRTPLNDTPQTRIVTLKAAQGFTIGERATLRDAIEADIHRTRKLGMMDFNRTRQSVRAAVLALPFLDAAAVRRLTDAPLPTKQDVMADLETDKRFLASL